MLIVVRTVEEDGSTPKHDAARRLKVVPRIKPIINYPDFAIRYSMILPTKPRKNAASERST